VAPVRRKHSPKLNNDVGKSFECVLLNAVMRVVSTVTCVPSASEALGTAAQIRRSEVREPLQIGLYWLAAGFPARAAQRAALFSAGGAEAGVLAKPSSGRSAALRCGMPHEQRRAARRRRRCRGAAVMPRRALRAGDERGCIAVCPFATHHSFTSLREVTRTKTTTR